MNGYEDDCDTAPNAAKHSSDNQTPEPAPCDAEKPAQGALSQVERNKRWRARNPEKYRDYQRELMRKRRAEGKA